MAEKTRERPFIRERTITLWTKETPQIGTETVQLVPHFRCPHPPEAAKLGDIPIATVLLEMTQT
eukprot:scaffold1820_cov129-Cylindrotheca_fusiformis.AAC.1